MSLSFYFSKRTINNLGIYLKYKALKDTLVQLNSLDMDNQKEEFVKIFDEWKGDFEQVDDVTPIGVSI